MRAAPRICMLDISGMDANRLSKLSNRLSNLPAVDMPMPGTPGILSDLSPAIAS